MQAAMLQRVYQRLYSEDYVIPKQHKSQVDTLFYLTRREIRDAVYLMSFFKNQKLNEFQDELFVKCLSLCKWSHAV